MRSLARALLKTFAAFGVLLCIMVAVPLLVATLCLWAAWSVLMAAFLPTGKRYA